MIPKKKKVKLPVRVQKKDGSVTIRTGDILYGKSRGGDPPRIKVLKLSKKNNSALLQWINRQGGAKFSLSLEDLSDSYWTTKEGLRN